MAEMEDTKGLSQYTTCPYLLARTLSWFFLV